MINIKKIRDIFEKPISVIIFSFFYAGLSMTPNFYICILAQILLLLYLCILFELIQ